MDSQQLDQILQQLKDIHFPNKISQWPPAPIYYIILGFIILTALAYIFYKKRQEKLRAKKFALNELKRIRTILRSESANYNYAIQSLSALLRQCALTAYPRQDVASLHGHDWLNFLDKVGRTNLFTTGIGKVLTTGPFQKDFTDFPEELIIISQKWIEKAL